MPQAAELVFSGRRSCLPALWPHGMVGGLWGVLLTWIQLLKMSLFLCVGEGGGRGSRREAELPVLEFCYVPGTVLSPFKYNHSGFLKGPWEVDSTIFTSHTWKWRPRDVT